MIAGDPATQAPSKKMTFIDESKPLRNMLLEDDHDDLEFYPPQTNRDGAGAWQRK